MGKIILFVMMVFILCVVFFGESVYAALNDYGRVPNRVATFYHANGGPARNNPNGYLWGK